MRRAVFCIAFAFLCIDGARASCGAAFCMVNTNWNLQGVVAQPGWRLDLRYEYVDQDQPRSGRRKVSVGDMPRHHDEVRTLNRNLLASADYTLDERWGVSVAVPIVDRDHVHIHNHQGARLPEEWRFTELGDMKLLGRYQLSAEDAARNRLSFYGVNFGLKLPTGRHDVRNDEGALAERSLQPGTGTTDVLLGAFFSRVLPGDDASWFVQALLQAPLDSREGYRPGERVSIDLGYRYEATSKLGLMVQLNSLFRSADQGENAEPEDTGGRFLYVSPGASYAITPALQVYGFLQLPLYQHVRGVQLTEDWALVAGLALRI